MKALVSIVLIASTFLAEVSALAGNHWCETERVKMETTESAEACANLEPSLIKTQVRKSQFAKPSVLALTYNVKDAWHIANRSVNLLYYQHLAKKGSLPIYLNNSVFLI